MYSAHAGLPGFSIYVFHRGSSSEKTTNCVSVEGKFWRPQSQVKTRPCCGIDTIFKECYGCCFDVVMVSNGSKVLASSAVSRVSSLWEKMGIQYSHQMLTKWMGKGKLIHASCKSNQLIFHMQKCLEFVWYFKLHQPLSYYLEVTEICSTKDWVTK